MHNYPVCPHCEEINTGWWETLTGVCYYGTCKSCGCEYHCTVAVSALFGDAVMTKAPPKEEEENV